MLHVGFQCYTQRIVPPMSADILCVRGLEILSSCLIWLEETGYLAAKTIVFYNFTCYCYVWPIWCCGHLSDGVEKEQHYFCVLFLFWPSLGFRCPAGTLKRRRQQQANQQLQGQGQRHHRQHRENYQMGQMRRWDTGLLFASVLPSAYNGSTSLQRVTFTT